MGSRKKCNTPLQTLGAEGTQFQECVVLPVRLAVLRGVRQVGEEASLQVGFNAVAMATVPAPQQLQDHGAPQDPLVVPRQQAAQQRAYFCWGVIK